MNILAHSANSLLLASLALAPTLPAQDHASTGPSIGALFPSDSFAVVEFAGLARCRAAAEESKIVDLVQRTWKRGAFDLDRLSGGEFGQTLAMMRRALAEVGLSAHEIHAVLDGPMAMGVGRPSVHSLMTPSVLVAIDTRGREAKIDALMQKLESMLPHLLEEAKDLDPVWSSLRIGEAKVRRLELTGVGFRIQYATKDGFLLIGTGHGYLENALEVMDGKAPGMRRHETHAKGNATLGAAPLLAVTINTEPLMRAIEPFAPYDSEKLLDALGLGTMRGIYFGAAMTKDGSHDAFRLDIEGSPRGLAKALFSKPGTGLGASFCGQDTVAYLNASIDPEAMNESLHALFDMLPAEVQHEIRRELQNEIVWELDKELDDFGLSHREIRAITRMLTGEVSVAVQIERQQPQGLVFAKFKDGEKAKREITAMLGKLFTGDRMPKLRYRKARDFWFASVRGGPIPMTPSIAFRGDTMILSPYRQALEEALKRYDEQGASLAQLQEYKDATQSMRPAALFTAIRYGKMIEPFWPLLRGQLDAQISHFTDSTADILPTTEEIRDAMGSMYGAMHADESGIHSSSKDPLGLATMVAACGCGLDWLLRQASGKID